MNTPDKSSNLQHSRYLLYGLLFLLAALIGATFILASVPPVDRDGLTHHLFVPKLYLNHGSIYEIPHIEFSYYPMNLELLYTVVLYYVNDVVPKYIHYFFALLTALLIYIHIKRRIEVHYALMGGIFFLSIPIIVKLSVTVYVDLGLIFFTTAALLSLLHWSENDFPARYLILAGLSCGLAAGTKYNGIVSIVILALLVPVIYMRSKKTPNKKTLRACQYTLLFITCALVAFSPWLIRNYAWTGNPIYPLHNTSFQRLNEIAGLPFSSSDISTAQSTGDNQYGNSDFVIRKLVYNEPLWKTLLVPIRVFFEGQDDNPYFFDGKLNPFLFILPAILLGLCIYKKKLKTEYLILYIFTVLYVFFTFSQTLFRIRYISPIVPPLVILSIYCIVDLKKFIVGLNIKAKKIKTYNIVIYTTIILALLYNITYIIGQFISSEPISYISGKVSREEYLSKHLAEYNAVKHANSTVKEDEKVLCIFLGNRGYYLEFFPIFERPTSNGFFTSFIENHAEGSTIQSTLKSMQISHVLLRNDLTVSWLQTLPKEHSVKITPFFQNNLKTLYHDKNYGFYEILTP